MTAAWLLAAVVALPLLGAAMAGNSLAPYFRFPPPLEIPRNLPAFSWFAVALVLLPFAAIAASWQRAIRAAPNPASVPRPPDFLAPRRPVWGWLALIWTLAWWVLAWTRWPWFAPLQPYTFFPLWFGFIVTVNALTCAATGTCQLRRSPRPWLALFAASAVFWWMFEWLNRFVHNWHYLAVERFGPLSYALHATLCFSTVLPAVAAVSEWLDTFPRLQRRLERGPPWLWLARKSTSVALIAGGLAALALTGARPQESYAALWAAPLALVIGAGVLAGRRGVWNEIAAGDWRRAGTWAIAALICGFFWEMWNARSLAKWIYTVPYVDRWHVFEMPLLGYLGYLPFGLECLVMVDALRGEERATIRKASPV